TDDDAHGGDGGDDCAADAVDHPTALHRDEQRQHEPDHRTDEADVRHPVGAVAEPADPADRRPSGLDEESGDEAPRDEGGDVRHETTGPGKTPAWKGGSMYPEERQHALALLVGQRGRVSVTTAAEQFGVTTETVRRDLAVLERAGMLRRVHGGAVPVNAVALV